MNFETAIKRLDEIVKNLQSGSMTLDESLKLFEEGTALISTCHSILNDAEQKIKILNMDGTTEDFHSES